MFHSSVYEKRLESENPNSKIREALCGEWVFELDIAWNDEDIDCQQCLEIETNLKEKR